MPYSSNMMSIGSVIILFLLSLTSLCHGEIVELTDATFEHETQASTGMTTGSWFVFFKAKNCPHCERIYPDFVELSNDQDLAEQGIVFATMDVPSNRATATRFDIRGFPSFLYFHKHKLYTVTGKRNAQAWKEFLTNGVMTEDTTGGAPIPPPLSALDQFVKTLKAAKRELADAASGKQGPEGYMVVGLVSILVLVLGGVVSLFLLPAKKQASTTTTTTRRKTQ